MKDAECIFVLTSSQSCGVMNLRLLAAHPESHHLLIKNILKGKEEGRCQDTLGNLGANACYCISLVDVTNISAFCLDIGLPLYRPE